MPRRLKRIVLVVLLFLALVVSAIVPVLIMLGLQERYLLFIPYGLFVVFVLFLVVRIESGGTDASAGWGRLPGFFAAHVFLTISGAANVAFFIASLIGPLPADRRFVSACALLAFAVVAVLKCLSGKIERLRARPFWIELLADALALSALLATAITVIFL